MDYRFQEMQLLSELLEAEATGRPFDRHQARRLASTLAEHHPEIGASMRLISERMAGEARA